MPARLLSAGVLAVGLVACGPPAVPTTTPSTAAALVATTPDPASSPTSAPTAGVRPPLSVEPVDVPTPSAADLVELVTDLSHLDLRVLHEAQGASEPDEVTRIGAQRYVGDGLVAFTEFATAMLAGVELPDEPLPVSDVEVLALGPGCIVARHVRGDQPPVTERLVATGTRDAPAWRVERTLTADQLDPDRACPRR